MNKYIIIFTSLLVLILLFFSPWIYWIDNGEDIVESTFFRKPLTELFSDPRTPICKSDGVDMYPSWAPFGATVKSCSYSDYYYVSFWWQKFHIE